MKYQVGDKVRLKKDLSEIDVVTNTMKLFAWRVVTISDIELVSRWFNIVEDNSKWGWNTDMIEEEEWKPKEWERVETECWEKIYLCTLKSGIHLVVPGCREEDYLRTWDPSDVLCLPTIERMPEKKERKLMMTDSEWEEFKSKNNINE